MLGVVMLGVVGLNVVAPNASVIASTETKVKSSNPSLRRLERRKTGDECNKSTN
jgi:hypothetical protein